MPETAAPENVADLRLPEDAAHPNHPFGRALKPWFEGVTVRMYGESYLRKDTLGGGSTGKAAVYEHLGCAASPLVVIKTARNDPLYDTAKALDNEHRVLVGFKERLASAADQALLSTVIPCVVPPLEGQAWDEQHLLMTPVCERLKVTKLNYAAVVRDLVMALRLAARAGYVHRDVRPANMMMSTEACADSICFSSREKEAARRRHFHAVLIDWAFAVEVPDGAVAVALLYEGTVSCASQRVLEQLRSGETTITVGSADDAESLVKALLRSISGRLMLPRKDDLDANAGQWLDVWALEEENLLPVRNAFAAARACITPTDDRFKALEFAILKLLKWQFVDGPLPAIAEA